jgi:capsular exopolysaccharide synthesis family protein
VQNFISGDAVRLAARLKASFGGEERLLLFTGVFPGEGVSTIVAQIARAFALMGETQVLLVDANLRAPSLHEAFELPRQPGLTEFLEAGAPLAVQATKLPNLSLLVAGRPAERNVELLLGERYSQLTEEIRERFPLVLMDSSPLLTSAETAALAQRADGVVLVVSRGRGKSELIEAARTLRGLNRRVVGAILSR